MMSYTLTSLIVLTSDRRGAIITAVLGIAICPWKLLTGTSVFLTVLSSFSVFVGPLTVRPLQFRPAVLTLTRKHTR